MKQSDMSRSGLKMHYVWSHARRTKVFLALWCPDSAKIKKKMVYSASFDSLKKAFNGVQKVIQANGDDEIDKASVEKILVTAART